MGQATIHLETKTPTSILHISTVKKFISDLEPNLLDGSPASNLRLNSISCYLFEETEVEAAWLETLLTEELYMALLGFKVLLEKMELCEIDEFMAEKRKEFMQWSKGLTKP